MPKREAKRTNKAGATKSSQHQVRDGGTHVSIRNSGLEVWLYDEANRELIRQPGPTDSGYGGYPPRFNEQARQGLVVGYSLQQDDDLEIAVYVGDPLTDDELSGARWLEPQRTFLRLPSGTLCIESNDCSRIGPELPTEKGAQVNVPAGDYGVTLYRVDHEALFRERLTWSGPQEVIVLTAGGSLADAADDLLPFDSRRDTDWVGKYTIRDKGAEVLVWFGDYWDTFVVNLDSTAAAQLSLIPGSLLRTNIPSVGLTLYSTFAHSWDDAARFARPDGAESEEYGYASLQPMGEWNGAEALFCRRETSKTRIENEYHGIWTPAVVDVIGVRPAAQTVGAFTATKLGSKEYFDDDFLTMVLSDVLPEAGDMDELPLPKALATLDKKLAKMSLTPQGDFRWQELVKARSVESSGRFYTGLPDTFAAIVVGDGHIEIVFLSEMGDAKWIVTGLADEIETRMMRKGANGLPLPHPNVELHTIDEPLGKILSAHQAVLRKSTRQANAAPQSTEQCVAAFGRFLTAVYEP